MIEKLLSAGPTQGRETALPTVPKKTYDGDKQNQPVRKLCSELSVKVWVTTYQMRWRRCKVQDLEVQVLSHALPREGPGWQRTCVTRVLHNRVSFKVKDRRHVDHVDSVTNLTALASCTTPTESSRCEKPAQSLQGHFVRGGGPRNRKQFQSW